MTSKVQLNSTSQSQSGLKEFRELNYRGWLSNTLHDSVGFFSFFLFLKSIFKARLYKTQNARIHVLLKDLWHIERNWPQHKQTDENTSSPRGFAELLEGKLNKLSYSRIVQLSFYNQNSLAVSRFLQLTGRSLNLVSIA